MSIYQTVDQRARRMANWQIALRTGVAGLAFVSAQAALANPSGGSVVAGSATISGQGSDRVRIDQASDRVVINWDSFSINADQGVDFRQPDARSIALNRVTGPEISQIMGELTANGQIYLINGNGIVFGKDAKVDVAGLVATSADIANDAFMGGGALRFGTPGRAGAKITNHGTITVRDAGIAAFVAPQVANDGIITAHMGRIAFGGAQAFTLDLHGDNLIRFQVGDAVKQIDDKGALVAIDGLVDARGGSLQITASAARDLVNQSVRIGTPQASVMQVGADGKVSLVAAKVTIGAPGEVQVGKNVAMDLSSGTNAAVAAARPAKGGNTNSIGWVGSLDGNLAAAPGQAMATNGAGGTLTISAARTILDGTINLDGSTAGGTAHITGSDFLSFGSILSASGAEAGGKIELDAGGFSLAGRITVNAGLGQGGSVDIHTTRRAIDTGDAFIDASGLHGGTIRYTSDQQIISSGKFRASGSHGFGGSIDVSAPRLDLFSAQFYAQGGIRGGRVRLGGEFQGGKDLSVDELLNARTLVATDAVTIDVSAIGMRGNAGEIVVWSDEKTTFMGTAIAQGGLVGGLGGQIEISGKETLVYRGTVETARDGQRGGKLLLDPKNIIIADASNAPSQYGLVLQAFASSFPDAAPAQPGLEPGNLFGAAVSLDGDRLAVGDANDNGADGNGSNVGAVYLFTFGSSSLTSPALSAIVGKGYTGGRNVSVDDLSDGDSFGLSVSLADTRLVVGAPFASGFTVAGGVPSSGVVYLFTFSDFAFSDGTVAGVLGSGFSGPASFNVTNIDGIDAFGSSVSLNGNRLAVGALEDDGFANSVSNSGAVYLFTFADSTFNAPVLEGIMGAGYAGGKNVSVALDVDDFFGWSVALSGVGLAIGAIGDDGEGNPGIDFGSAYLYSFAAADFSVATLQSTLGFGYSGTNDVNLFGLENDDRFGASLGLIGGESFAVLADGDDGLAGNRFDSGAAYLFNFSDAFFQGPVLVGTIGADYASLGGRNLSIAGLGQGDTITSLSLGFDGLVLGVSEFDPNTGSSGGTVYLFSFADTAFNDGRQVGKLGTGVTDFSGLSLIGAGLDRFDDFGASASLDGNRLAVGAPGDGGLDNDKPSAGAVYLFTFGDPLFNAPVLQAIIGSGYSGGKNVAVPRLEATDQFGAAVSLDGFRLAVGAPGDDGRFDDALNAGAVYLFGFDNEAFAGGGLEDVLSFESFTFGTIASEGGLFGSAVSLSGGIIAVGATGDPGNDPMAPLNNAGAVHIIDLSSINPTLLSTIGKGYSGVNNIDMPDLDENDSFGSAVSLDGLRLAVGAPGDDGFQNDFFDTGAAYLFTFAASDYSGGVLSATLGAFYGGPNDFTPIGLGLGSTDQDFFGSSLSLNGLQLAVGAEGDDGRVNTLIDSGAVYLFTFANSDFSGVAQASVIGGDYPAGFSVKLSPADAFGAAVSLDAGRLVVGAPGQGAAFLFSFAGSNFAGPRLHDTLSSDFAGQRNVSVGQLSAGDQFGGSVSLNGTRLAIGAPFDDGANETQLDSGAVYLFSFADLAFNAPVLEAIIGLGYSGGKNVSVATLGEQDLFGASVSLDFNQLAVGAPGDQGAGDASGPLTGAVYLFSYSSSPVTGDFNGITLRSTIGSGYVGADDINMSDVVSLDAFGSAVSLLSNQLAVGSPGQVGFDGSGFLPGSGAVYLFSFTDQLFTGGVVEAYIGRNAPVGGNDVQVVSLAEFDNFGGAVALSQGGNLLYVGTPGDDGATGSDTDSGAVYQFSFTNGFVAGALEEVFGRGYSVNVSSLGSSDRFGSSVSAQGFGLAIGAPSDSGVNNSVESAGAVYLFGETDGGIGLMSVIGAGYGDDQNGPIGKLEIDDFFGASVSLDRNRLAVGASGDDGVQNTNGSAGAVYLFSFLDENFDSSNPIGTLGTGYGAAKNLDLPSSFADNLGASVSLLGNQLAIGVPGASQAGGGEVRFGAVYLFTFADAEFSGPTLRGIIGQGYTGAGNFNVGVLQDNDRFGAAVSLDGLRLAVGAPGDNGANNDTAGAGAVYLFSFADTSFGSPALESRVGRNYTLAKNVSVALDGNDRFGTSVSLAGTQLAVGTPGDDGVSGSLSDAGAVLLFNFTTPAFDGGELAGTIGSGYNTIAGDLDLAALEVNDRFGSSVAQSGLALAVGAIGDQGLFNLSAAPVGAVYTFLFADVDFDGPALNSTIGLDYGSGSGGPFDISIGGLGAGDEFGAALAFDGLQLFIGAPGDAGANDRAGANTGAVYQLLFGDATLASAFQPGRVGRGYASGGDLSVIGLASGDRFGAGLALNAGRMVAGAPGDDGVFENRSGSGAAYLFTAANNGLGSGLALAGTIGSGYANGLNKPLGAQGLAILDRLGTAVALDGTRLAIGAPDDSGVTNNASSAGAVYLVTFADLAFGAPVLQAIVGSGYTGGKNLSVANLRADDQFGISLSLDAGGLLAVGASGDDGFDDIRFDSGAAYVFSFADPVFSGLQLQSIIGHGYTGPGNFDIVLNGGDLFGSAVGISGLDLAIGARGDDGFGDTGAFDDSGAVHLFQYDAANSAATLVGTIGSGYSGGSSIDLVPLETTDLFGSSLSLDAGRLVVGAPNDLGAGNSGGAASSIGAVYLFTFSGGAFAGGAHVSTIGLNYSGPGDFAVADLDFGDRFGIGVSLDGNRLAIGANGDDGFTNVLGIAGAVHLFSFADAAFASPSQQATIGAFYNGGNNVAVPLDILDSFGSSVALDGNRLAVGAMRDAGAANALNEAGAVYLFTFGDADFGGGRLVGQIGAGYRSSAGLELAAPVTPTFVQVGGGDIFGSALSLDGTRLAIGAPLDDGSIDGLPNAGAVYLFTFTDARFGGASLQSVIGHGYVGGKNIFVTEVEANDGFGFAVSLDGNRLVVGAPFDGGFGNVQGSSGAVYLFTFTDAVFGGGVLEGIIGLGYAGRANLSVGDLEVDDRFGTSVSLDGNRLAVGAIGDDGAGNPSSALRDPGAVYLFSFAGAQFQSGTLEAIFGLGFNAGSKDLDIALDDFDLFGSAVSLDGNRLVVGAPFDDGDGNGLANAGAAYMFTFDDLAFTGGVQRGIIGASYAGPGDIDNVLTPFGMGSGSFFGSAVSLDGNRLAVGGPRIVSTAASPFASGAVYLLTFTDSSFGGGSIAEILAKGATGFGANIDFDVELDGVDLFGTAVSLDGNRLVVGAEGDDGFGNSGALEDSGAVYLFTFEDADFNGAALRGTLGANYSRGASTVVPGLQALDSFGWALSLDGTRLAIGAPQDRGASGIGFAGAVYLFTFANADFDAPTLEGVLGQGYTGPKSLSVPGLADSGFFGGAVSLDGNRLAVGASNLSDGSVFLFTFADAVFNSPSLVSRIGAGASGPNDLSIPIGPGDFFGFSVSLEGNRLAVGAPLDDGLSDALADVGAVYLFSFADSLLNGPTQEAVIGAGYSGGKNVNLAALDAGDHFGSSVSLQSLRLVIGAEYDDGGSGNVTTDTGAAYLFAMSALDFSGVTLAGTIGRNYSGAGDLDISRLDSNDWFGRSVSLDGNRLAIGAVNDAGASDLLPSSGAVYVIGFADAAFGTPSLISIFGQGYGGAGDASVDTLDGVDFFGNAVSLDSGRLVVGAPFDDGPDNQVQSSGAAYFFNLSGGAGSASSLAFADLPGADVTISAASLSAVLSGGTAVELQANNDITVNSAILANNMFGNGGALTLRAGRSILINAAIITDSSDFNAIANDFASSGVVDAFRDAGDAVISFGPGGSIGAGFGFVNLSILAGDDKTFSSSGAISVGSITGRAISIVNQGSSGNRAVNINTGALLTGVTAGDAIVIDSDVFTNNAGAGAFNLVGGGRFLVYSTDYDVITRGGLIGNNLYNLTPASSITQPGNLFVFSRQPILTFTADNASRTYGQASPTYTFQVAGLVNGDTGSYAFSGAPNVFDTASGNAGTDPIFINQGTLASSVGYGFNFVNGSLTTLRALLTVTADSATREYGLANPAFTGSISGFLNSDTASVVSGLVYGSVATAASDVGTYAIIGSGATAANYNFSYVPGTLTITRALLTVTADSVTREYGLANPAFGGTVTGLRNSDTPSVISGLVYGSVATMASNVGSYVITGSGATALNYNFAYVPGTLSITPATLTVAIDNKTRVYGSANPALTASITGFRNGEDASLVSGLRLRTGAIGRTDVGSYMITGSGANAANYRFDYLPGTMTITKALLQVRVDNASREYGLANPEFTARITGFRNGDNASVINGLTFGTPALIGSDVGNYAITASGASALNYDFSYVPGRLTINQARLLITADSLSMTDGSADPVLTVSFEGLRNGDTPDVVTGLVLRSSGGGSVGPGQYIINASRGTARNYQITYRPGVMTVIPVPPPAQDPPAPGASSPPVPGASSPPATDASAPPAPGLSDPPATGDSTNPPVFTFVPPAGGTTAPEASPPATGGDINPPVFTFVPPAGGSTTSEASQPSDLASAPVPPPLVPPEAAPTVAAPAVAAPPASNIATPVTNMPVQGAVSLPVPPENLSPLQLLQGLSAPLPVMVAPESRPDDGDGVRDPSQGDGQRIGCAYISLCHGAVVPLWSFQPAQ